MKKRKKIEIKEKSNFLEQEENIKIPKKIVDDIDFTEEDIEDIGNTDDEEEKYTPKESLFLYFNEIKKEKLLTEDEEKKLLKLAKKGNLQAKEKLIKSNLKLVVKIAKNYENFGIPLVDLIEEGNIGLIRAIEKFSIKKGFRFSTYATWWIRQSIYRAIANQRNIIRIPVHILEIYHKYLKIIDNEIKNTGSYPSKEKIIKKLKISESKLNEILNIVKTPKSLDLEYEDEDSDNTKTLKDTIEDKSFIKPDDETIEIDKKERILKILDKLKPKEQQVVILRFGLNGQKIHTLEEIGKKMNLTRERIRQIESIALRKLRFLLKTKENF